MGYSSQDLIINKPSRLVARPKPTYTVGHPLVCPLGRNALERQKFIIYVIKSIDDGFYVVVFPAT